MCSPEMLETLKAVDWLSDHHGDLEERMGTLEERVETLEAELSRHHELGNLASGVEDNNDGWPLWPRRLTVH